LYSQLFKQVAAPTHLKIGLHWDEALFRSLIKLHPGFVASITHFQYVGADPTERIMGLLASWTSLEILEIKLLGTFVATEGIRECQGFSKLREIRLTVAYPDEAYTILSSINSKSAIARLTLEPYYEPDFGTIRPKLLFPDTSLLKSMVDLEVHFAFNMPSQLADDFRSRRLGSFKHLQNLVIKSEYALSGSDESWGEALRGISQLRTLCLAEHAKSFEPFQQANVPTLRLIHLAMECCPFLIRFAGTLDLDEQNIPIETPITKKHLHIRVIDLGASYFTWYDSRDLEDDFEMPNGWVDRVVTYLASMGDHVFEIGIADRMARSDDGIVPEFKISRWQRNFPRAFRRASKAANDRKRNIGTVNQG
jgi:hypothetical protein